MTIDINYPYSIILFILEIFLLFLVSKATLNEIFHLLRIFIKSDKAVFTIVSLFFLPGTIIHEMAHFLMATVLLLRVIEIKIFPEFEKNYIKLGKVLYEKQDVVRGVLVGLAPIVVGLGFFWWLSAFQIFPQQNLVINIVVGYVVYTVSSTMFSSKQDLIDLVFVIPVLLIVAGICYVFNLNPGVLLKNNGLVSGVNKAIKDINFYLLFSLGINLIFIFVIKSIKVIYRR